MYWNHSGVFPLFGEHAMRKENLEETTDEAGQFRCTFSKDFCWYFIRSHCLCWINVTKNVSNVFGFEVHIGKRGCWSLTLRQQMRRCIGQNTLLSKSLAENVSLCTGTDVGGTLVFNDQDVCETISA